MEKIETINYKGYQIVSIYDTDAQNPRENDNLGTLYTNRKNYNFDNKSVLDLGCDQNEWEDNLVKNFHFIPISYYEHSGISINPMEFDTIPSENSIRGWDRGFFGFYAVEKDNKEVKGMTLGKIEEILRSEIDELSAWMNGECYGYIVYDADGEEKESCWGYIGEEGYEVMMDEAKGYCDAHEVCSFRLKVDELTREELVNLYFENFTTCPQCIEFMDMIEDNILKKYIKDKLCDELKDGEKEDILSRFV